MHIFREVDEVWAAWCDADEPWDQAELAVEKAVAEVERAADAVSVALERDVNAREVAGTGSCQASRGRRTLGESGNGECAPESGERETAISKHAATCGAIEGLC